MRRICQFCDSIVGYGRFIGSATQEEIMQVCCPEFNVAMLHIGMLDSRSILVVHGVRRYRNKDIHTTSIRRSMEWWRNQSILTMDATTSQHTKVATQLRDIGKALATFSSVAAHSDAAPSA